MKTRFQLLRLAALALLSSFMLHPSSLLGQGSLTPPGVPAPTMKSLAQIEPRTPISSAPFTISAPGSYYLTTNVTVSTGDAITVATNGVTLNLGGFMILSTAPSATGAGIVINSGLRNITIADGFIQGGVTNNGAGVFSGGGFGYGITYLVSPPANVSILRVSVSGCLNHGINLALGESSVVESCTVRTVGADGIVATIIKTSAALGCGGTAIYGNQVSDCRGQSILSGQGIDAVAVLNSSGFSSGAGTGVLAKTAENCYGYSGGFVGVSASNVQNCNGYCGSWIGISALTAQNSYGYSNGSGNGLNVTTAQNSYGQSVSGTGVFGETVQNCYGYSTSGTGLSATIAIGCSASGSPAFSLTTHRYFCGSGANPYP